MTARLHDPPCLIGRDAELADVQRWLALLADGPAALVIHGEAGIGKSTIWSAAMAEGAARGARVLVSRPVEIWEFSPDDGATWVMRWEIAYRRRGA